MLTIASLDGLRALAVLIVAVSHAGFGKIIPGGLGVTIFFFLSGFLITTLLMRERASNHRINVPAFYCRRFLRLFPPLAITLLLAYGLVLAGVLGGRATGFGFLAQLFYFANYYILLFNGGPNVPIGTGILWSLAVEEHYYILFPLLIVSCLKWSTAQRFSQILILLCVLALMWRIYLALQPSFNTDRAYYATDTRFDSIIFGAVLSVLKNPCAVAQPNESMDRTSWMWFGLGLLGIIFSIGFREAFFRDTFRYTVQGISLMPIFYFLIYRSGDPLFRPFNWRWVQSMGVYSYSIYLIHLIVISLLQEHLHLNEQRLLCLALALCIATAYAMLIDRFVDVPLQRVRARYR